MSRAQVLVAAVVVALAGGGVGAVFAFQRGSPQHPSRGGLAGGRIPKPPPGVPYHVVVNVFGQPSGPAEAAGSPLDKTLALFRSSRLAAALPAPSGAMGPLATVAGRLEGEPGTLLPGETRRVVTPAGPIYLVPTTRGWVCMQGRRFEACERGLLPQGVDWHFQSAGNGVDVVGIASNAVSGVVLTYGKTVRRALLHDNVFFVHRPASFTAGQRVFAIGTLTISYRNGGPPALVPLR